MILGLIFSHVMVKHPTCIENDKLAQGRIRGGQIIEFLSYFQPILAVFHRFQPKLKFSYIPNFANCGLIFTFLCLFLTNYWLIVAFLHLFLTIFLPISAFSTIFLVILDVFRFANTWI